VNVLKTDFEVSSRIAWILAFWRGKRSKRALVMNAIKVLIMAIGVSHSAGSDSMSSGSVSTLLSPSHQKEVHTICLGSSFIFEYSCLYCKYFKKI
jgi:hypothetical protein